MSGEDVEVGEVRTRRTMRFSYSPQPTHSRWPMHGRSFAVRIGSGWTNILGRPRWTAPHGVNCNPAVTSDVLCATVRIVMFRHH